MLMLYCAPKTVSVAVAIGLEEAGLAYDTTLVDFASAAQTQPAYLSVNPKGRVPALVTAAGTLAETGAILEYIAATSGKLMPDTPLKAARVRELMYYLASTMHINHAHRLRGARWANEAASIADMQAKVPETMGASCAHLEETLILDPFVSDAISIADVYLYVLLTWLPSDSVDINAYPKLAGFYDMMGARPSIKATMSQGLLEP